VKFRLVAASALFAGSLLIAPASAQVSLVVGSVRDQHGAPIAGATISASTTQGRVSTTTDRVGTFALEAAGVDSVSIACRYCPATVVSVRSGEPVVAIIRRYDTLIGDSPSPDDLANLPYAHVESAVALRPFTLLQQSSGAYPGSLLSDRGLSPSGSLLIDNGAPVYDVVAGQSPYLMIPADYQQSAKLDGAANAFLYGDQAGGGIVELQPFVSGYSAQVGTLGSNAIARAQAGTDADEVAAGSSSDDQALSQRADLSATWQLPADQSIEVAGGSEQGREYSSAATLLASSFSFADAAFTDPRALNLTLSSVVDRGSYVTSGEEYPTSTAWSDSGFGASIHSSGSVAGFADLAVRSSTGLYDAQALEGVPSLAATLVQTRADVGVDVSEPDYTLRAGIGTFWIGYAGGAYAGTPPAHAQLAVPSLQAQLFPNGKWSASLEASGSFALPTFLEQYQYAGEDNPAIEFTRSSLWSGQLTYTDDSRLRCSFEEASEDVRGATSGTITSAGLSAAWQIAPVVALRAWTMHVTDTAPIYPSTLTPYLGIAPTVNALWLTYDNGSLRIDAIYRRDLLDNDPFYHFDAAISGPISERLRWYAGTEDWMHRTFVNAGLRFAAR
jgi:Carboxypeptidase regulatory-like domain